MTQEERRIFLIRYLAEENSQSGSIHIPDQEKEQKQLLRSLMNVRLPFPVSEEFIRVQDNYLAEEREKKGVVELSELTPVQPGIYLWQGDITRLRADAITNAANKGLLGCFIPCHGCIDNAIHSQAGVKLRLECNEIMKRQGKEEETGRAKITRAYNLPCRYVIHTVGPVIDGPLTPEDRRLLESCYLSCLELACSKNLRSIAFCCISTGEFHFPNEEAARIAVGTVSSWRKKENRDLEVVFNVFKEEDARIYRRILGQAF